MHVLAIVHVLVLTSVCMLMNVHVLVIVHTLVLTSVCRVVNMLRLMIVHVLVFTSVWGVPSAIVSVRVLRIVHNCAHKRVRGHGCDCEYARGSAQACAHKWGGCDRERAYARDCAQSSSWVCKGL